MAEWEWVGDVEVELTINAVVSITGGALKGDEDEPSDEQMAKAKAAALENLKRQLKTTTTLNRELEDLLVDSPDVLDHKVKDDTVRELVYRDGRYVYAD